VRADEWSHELADTLAHGWGGPATMTVAAGANASASKEVIATARKTVAAAGWDLYEIDARKTDAPLLRPLPRPFAQLCSPGIRVSAAADPPGRNLHVMGRRP
jgi:hypothetical protein